jgi:plastocyanin
MGKYIEHNHNHDGIDRRGFLKCMAWAGTGVIWFMHSGVLKSAGLSQIIDKTTGKIRSDINIAKGDFTFVQISDSHIGFNKDANPDVVGTLQAAISKINALPDSPSFVIHTGDLSHLSKPSEFDTLDQVLKSVKTDKIFFVPGEHDFLSDNGEQYLNRYGKGTKGSGWYSFDKKGTHFVGLVNVVNLKAGGLGILGTEQLEWLEDDLKGQSSSTPIVVFAHIPLWSVFPQWGWGTDDSAQALSYLRRFGSVTVLNGHIHQNIQKIEGNITFHTAMSTAFPQPVPGTAPAPGPMKVPAERLRTLLGLSSINYMEHMHTLAIIDTPLISSSMDSMNEEKSDKSETKPSGKNTVVIENFSFNPKELVVSAGTVVTWINNDDSPHFVLSTDKIFSSTAMDTNDKFTFKFSTPGNYKYFCKIHPMMTGTIIVK